MKSDDLDQALRETLGGNAPSEVHADAQPRFDALKADLQRRARAPKADARDRLLPDFVKHPMALLWVAVLPQIILLLINLRGYHLVASDIDPRQRIMWFNLIGLQVFMLLAESAGLAVLRSLKRPVSRVMNWPLLIVPLFFLWLVMWQTYDMVPRSFAIWVLRPDELLFHNFTFVMPVILYATLRLACVESDYSRPQEIGMTFAALVAPVVAWLFLISIGGIWLGGTGPRVVLVSMAIACTVLMFGALMRLCVMSFNSLRRSRPAVKSTAMFLVCVCAPLGGLCLNGSIPFPVDFQAWHVYALALVNGLLLTLPRFQRPLLRRTVWLAQCALFPFSLYFFVVFMPYLPLSIPAMIVIGSGFLILTPTVLFLLHSQQIIDGFQWEVRGRPKLVPALLATLALLILPGIFVGETARDRASLNKAIDYVYNPDYRSPDDHFAGSPAAIERSLEHLRDYKAGVYMPFLSDFYDWYVFGKLVLPNEKMNTIHRAFFAGDLGPAKSDRFGTFGGERGRASFDEIPQGPQRGPSGNTTATCVTVQKASEAGCERRTVSLDISNNSSTTDEFVTDVQLPPGVLISAFRLKVGDQIVPGQVFEKKTALWVYQTIRDYESWPDPGILVYTDPGSVQLRVSPVAPHETRHAEIEFLYPAGINPQILIGGKPIEKEADADALILTNTEKGGAVAISPSMLAQLPAAPRAPYLHFIIDRSAKSHLTDDQVLAYIHHAAAQFPEAKECAITFANYESVPAYGPPAAPAGRNHIPLVDIASITASSPAGWNRLPARGGFLPGRVIKRSLLAYHDHLSHADPGAEGGNPWYGKYPVFIIIRGNTDETPAFGNDLPAFEKLAPDMDRFYVNMTSSTFEGFDFNGKSDPRTLVIQVTSNPASPITAPDLLALHPPHPTVLLRLGNTVSACPADGDQAQIATFETQSQAGTALSVLDHGVFRTIAPTATIAANTPYARGERAWQEYLDWVYNPSLGNEGLAGVVRMSRESGILTAATSLIVVENDAQWKLLQLKQSQKLGNKTALEFTETPEPSTWALIVISAALLFIAARRKRRAGRA